MILCSRKTGPRKHIWTWLSFLGVFFTSFFIWCSLCKKALGILQTCLLNPLFLTVDHEGFRTITTNLKEAMLPWPLGTWRSKNAKREFSAGFFFETGKKGNKNRGSLYPYKSNHLLRMVMELKYFAFRRWLDTPCSSFDNVIGSLGYYQPILYDALFFREILQNYPTSVSFDSPQRGNFMIPEKGPWNVWNKKIS